MKLLSFTMFIWMVLAHAHHQAPAPEHTAPLMTIHPRSWYADILEGGMSVSPSGVLYRIEGERRLWTAKGGHQNLEALMDMEKIYGAFWNGAHIIEAKGIKNGSLNWFTHDLRTGQNASSTTPVTYLSLAYRGSYHFTYLAEDGVAMWRFHNETKVRERILEILPDAMAISADGTQLAWLTLEEKGHGATLFHKELPQGEARIVARNLDVGYQGLNLAFGPKNKEVYVSMAGSGPADPLVRNQAGNDRHLDLYAIALEAGTSRKMFDWPGRDNRLVGVADGHIYWMRAGSDMEVGLLPAEGGTFSSLGLQGTTNFPSWHPTEETLAVMYGDWHLVDWVLNWELGQVSLSDRKLKPLVTGNHEDYAANWSPDGRWLAYHSHRATQPVGMYATEETTDDIFIRLAAGGPEIQITHQVGIETGEPNWSPDGRHLVFVTQPAKSKPVAMVVTIDPLTGTSQNIRTLEVPGLKGGVLSASWSSRNEIALEEEGKKLWLMDPDGGNARIIHTYDFKPSVGGTHFSPDGTWLVFAALVDGHHQLFRINRDGTGLKQLTHGNRELFHPAISPDGKRIAVTRYQHVKQLFSKPL